MRPLYESVKEDKSEADKMFEELGYGKYTQDTRDWCKYENEFHIILFGKELGNIYIEDKKDNLVLFKPKVIQAINLKCKELGWID